ncbi:MAG: glycosyltransferase [Patescibacteria group bacterium]|jgi:glycosyltransferase involved in cell wall biosynthesis
MKICLINNLYKPYNRGGAERVVEAMADDYARKGDEVFIITTRPSFRITNYKLRIKNLSDRDKIFHIPGFYYNLAKLPFPLRLIWHVWDMFDFISYFRVKKILKKEKPDLVITHNLKGIGYLIPRLIKRLGVAHHHYLHDIQLIYPSGLLYYGEEKKLNSAPARIYQQICVRLFSSPDKVISPTNWLMDLHGERGFFKRSKLEIKEFLTGGNELRIKNCELRIKNAGKAFKFLFVGQVERHKGVEMLIKAFSGLKAKAELLIIGDGSFLPSLKGKAGDEPRIKFLGRKSPEEVEKLMSESDCLIVPSLCWENAPAVIYEAYRAGLPVIASRIGGIPEIIAKLGGELFTPGNIMELEKLMNKAYVQKKNEVL